MVSGVPSDSVGLSSNYNFHTWISSDSGISGIDFPVLSLSELSSS